MMNVYAIANQKGGVGKTATVANLGAALAELGRRVVVIDFDPQGHLTDTLGVAEAPAEGANLARALLGQFTGELGDLLVEAGRDLYLIPTSDDMFIVEQQMYGRSGREYLLSRFVDALRGWADDVLIDCPPSLGVLTDNGLVAARTRPEDDGIRGRVIVPVQAEDSSLKALRLFVRQVATLSEALTIDLDLAGMVVTQYDKRRGQIPTSTLEALEAHPTGVLMVIGDRKEIREGWRLKQTVLAHAPMSVAASWYRDLAKKLSA
jgi:chromosome partitioning protein